MLHSRPLTREVSEGGVAEVAEVAWSFGLFANLKKGPTRPAATSGDSLLDWRMRRKQDQL